MNDHNKIMCGLNALKQLDKECLADREPTNTLRALYHDAARQQVRAAQVAISLKRGRNCKFVKDVREDARDIAQICREKLRGRLG
jgi:hypothetical protein